MEGTRQGTERSLPGLLTVYLAKLSVNPDLPAFYTAIPLDAFATQYNGPR